MARMIPTGAPNTTDSYKAEPDIYWRLAKLDNEFTVIHSLPWLCGAVKTLDKNYAPTGELDFIIIHPKLGILAIEVKGGKFKYDQYKFTYLKNNQLFDPIGQLRRNVFSLSKWVQKAGFSVTVGYAWIFPDVNTKGKPLPPAMEDITFDEKMVIDYSDLPNTTSRIKQIMEYLQKANRSYQLTTQQINEFVDLICPSVEYGLDWGARIDYENKTWLALSDQQTQILKNIVGFERTTVSGRPGTGKTILAITLARELAKMSKKVLFLLFNKRIAEKISKELNGLNNVQVMTFHQLCWGAANRLKVTHLTEDEHWFDTAHIFLKTAIEQRKMDSYDALIIDEGQVFHREWYNILKSWFEQIHVFCDETQAFNFEQRLRNSEVEDLIDAEHRRILTINMRSPKDVFDRLDISLPSEIQQSSPRPPESDTLQEVISTNHPDEILKILHNLHKQGATKQDIAVITSSHFLNNLKKGGFDSEIQTLADLDTSERVRGLEFPIVLAVGIGTFDISPVINAYARATTKVIALYLDFEIRNADKNELFIGELISKPEISIVLNNSWDFSVSKLGWHLIPILNSPKIYWHQDLEVLVMEIYERLSVYDELYATQILLNSSYPLLLVQIQKQRDFATFAQIELEPKNLNIPKKSTPFEKSAFCSSCGKYHLKSQDGKVLCAHCSSKRAINVPSSALGIIEQIQNLHIQSNYENTAILALEELLNLPQQEQELIQKYTYGYFMSDKTTGYQPLLIWVGCQIIKAQSGDNLSIKKLTDSLVDILGETKRNEIQNTLPHCTNFWIQKKWLQKIEGLKGTYKIAEMEKWAL